MGMFRQLKIGGTVTPAIDWEMTPDMTFGTFESWGGREQMRSKISSTERVYYFFVDNWGDTPKLCLMERGVKHARVLAEIKAPEEMVQSCVTAQGTSSLYERSYAIDERIKEWLVANVLTSDDTSLVVPFVEEEEVEDMGALLPTLVDGAYQGEMVELPAEQAFINDGELGSVLGKWNLFDAKENPEGRFANDLADTGDGLTVVDQRTGLMWQRGGLDITAIRTMRRNVEQLNKENFAGHNDWRMPSMEEAMSLMEPERNNKGTYLQPCFSKEQPFIFVAAKRQPGGYWFVDFKQGRAFWSSGTIPGGFARLCRKA